MEFLKINKFAWLLAIACACLIPNMAEAEQVYYINSSLSIYEKSTNDTDTWTNVFTDLNGNVTNIQFEEGWNAFFYARSESGTYIIYKKNVADSWIWTPLTTTAVNARFFSYAWTTMVYCYGDRMYMRDNSDVLYDWYDIGPCSYGFEIALSPNWIKILHKMSDWLYLKEISDSWTWTLVLDTWSIFSWQSTNSEWKFCYSDWNIKCTENFWNDPVPWIDLWFASDFFFFFLKDNPDWFVYRGWYAETYRPIIYNWSTSSVLTDATHFQGWSSGYIPKPPTPPTVVSQINGLNCVSEIIPDLWNVTWYDDFMGDTWFLSSVDDDGWIRFFSWSGSIDDLPEAEYVNRAWLFYADQTAWGNFASGSLNYPWTARTTIRWWNESPLLLSFSDSEVKPNVVQWHWVNSVALWYAGTVQFRNTKNQDTNEVPLSESGGVATAVISWNDRIRKVLLNYSSWFNWFRYWVAPVISKSSCSYKYNLCEWSIEWENTVCQSWNLVWWIPAWNCVLTSSWSVYGSWSCVPETTASGAIIPPILVPWVTVYDSEGNAVWNIYENESPVPDFSCWFADDDWWIDTIWKGIKCFFNLIQTSVSSTKDWIDIIQGTSQTLWQSVDINPTTSTWSATGALSNPLLAQLQWVEEEASETKYLKMTFWFFVFFFTILIVAVLATVLKWGIKRYFNQ